MTERLSVLQSASVRVWVNLSPAHTVPVDGAQALTEQVFGGGGGDGGSGLQGPLSTCRVRVSTAGLHRSAQGFSASAATEQVRRWE